MIAEVFITLFVAHQVGDHWVQTDHQAAHKGLPGWLGRLACAAHVLTYTVTAAIALAILAAVSGWNPGLPQLAAGLAVSAVTHYVADRRTPLVRMARWVGLSGFVRLGAPRPGRDDNPSLGTGAYALDQSWHYLWLFVAALVIGS